MKSARDRMSIISAYQQVGTYRGAAAVCGTTHKTVKRVIERFEAERAGHTAVVRPARKKNFEEVAALVADGFERTQGRVSAKRLLPAARTAGYTGSDRNFRRLVAAAKRDWRGAHHRGRHRWCGLRVSIWSSTGGSSAPDQGRFTCSRPSWRGLGGGS